MPKSDALKELEKIFFPVAKVPANEEQDHSSWLSHEILVWPDPKKPDRPRRVNVCSQDYGLISNQALILPIWDAIAQDWPDINCRVSMYDYAQFYIDIWFEGRPLRGASKKDALFPRLRINNSYNGSVKFSFDLGLWRLICGNGATAPVPESTKSGIFMHTSQLKEDGSAAELVMEKMTSFMKDAKKIVRGYDPLIEHTLSEGAAVDRILEVQQNTDYPKKLTELAMERLSWEANELKQPINDYLVYNAMNYALFNTNESSLPTHKKDKKDQEVFQFLLADNK